MKADAFIQHILDIREKAMLDGRDIERIYISEKMGTLLREYCLDRILPKTSQYFNYDYDYRDGPNMLLGMDVTIVKDKDLHYLDFKYRIPRMTGVC